MTRRPHVPRSVRVASSLPLVRAVVFPAALAVAIVSPGSTEVLACPQCFGAEETTVMAGTKLGVLVLLVITLAIQGAFVGFFVYLRTRAKRIAEIELDSEWSELQRAKTP